MNYMAYFPAVFLLGIALTFSLLNLFMSRSVAVVSIEAENANHNSMEFWPSQQQKQMMMQEGSPSLLRVHKYNKLILLNTPLPEHQHQENLLKNSLLLPLPQSAHNSYNNEKNRRVAPSESGSSHNVLSNEKGQPLLTATAGSTIATSEHTRHLRNKNTNLPARPVDVIHHQPSNNYPATIFYKVLKKENKNDPANKSQKHLLPTGMGKESILLSSGAVAGVINKNANSRQFHDIIRPCFLLLGIVGAIYIMIQSLHRINQWDRDKLEESISYDIACTTATDSLHSLSDFDYGSFLTTARDGSTSSSTSSNSSYSSSRLEKQVSGGSISSSSTSSNSSYSSSLLVKQVSGGSISSSSIDSSPSLIWTGYEFDKFDV